MYTPKINQLNDIKDILAFIDRFSFGILISRQGNRIIGTHLPIISNNNPEELFLYTHIALANEQWKEIEGQEVLIIFTEPHAYISPSNYLKEETVPTWNYVAVHMYGQVSIIQDEKEINELMTKTMIKYEPEYYEKWLTLSEPFKANMMKGIVPFKIDVTGIEGKAKLSQNKNHQEKENIIKYLNQSQVVTDSLLAEYMELDIRKKS